MNEKFTPGPWRVRDERIVGANGQTIRMSGVALPCGCVPKNDESFYNMNLAAAAPEMYEALKLMVELHGNTNVMPTAQAHRENAAARMAISALKKARGES